MIQIKAPNLIPHEEYSKFRVFFAGSIEMGKAEDWQTKLAKLLEDEDILILNPRRDDWDSSWKQEKTNQQFNEQVTWEMDNIDRAQLVVFYFDKNTQSPVTLLELGMNASQGNSVVLCPKEYFRKGNVDIFCDRFDIPQVNTLEDLAQYVKVEYYEDQKDAAKFRRTRLAWFDDISKKIMSGD